MLGSRILGSMRRLGAGGASRDLIFMWDWVWVDGYGWMGIGGSGLGMGLGGSGGGGRQARGFSIRADTSSGGCLSVCERREEREDGGLGQGGMATGMVYNGR